MSVISVVHPSRPRVYVRRFDHEEAARRVAAGERVRDLAAEYGVTINAVYQAVRLLDPAKRAATNDYQRRQRTTVCETCGGPAMSLTGGKKAHNPDGRVLCNHCRAWERTERVRFDELGQAVAARCSSSDCVNGERWQPLENFSSGKRHRIIRPEGISSQCRACQSRARSEYRARHRVPCVDCGQPVEGKGRPNSRTDRGGRAPIDPGRPHLCRACWWKRRRA